MLLLLHVLMHGQLPSILKDCVYIPWAQTSELLSVQSQPGLFAQSPCPVKVVIPLLGRIKSELCVAACVSLSPPPVLGALGRCEVRLRAAWAEPGQVCLTWLNPLWLLHSHLAVPHLCSSKKTIFKLLVYIWKWRVYFRGLLGYENKPSGGTLKMIFIIKLLRNFQEMEPQTGATRKNINSI